MKKGDKIKFLQDICDESMGDRPAHCYARKGEIGTVVEIDFEGDELIVKTKDMKFQAFLREVAVSRRTRSVK